MDAAEAPVRGDLDQVGPPVAVRHQLVDILVEVQREPAVAKISVGLAVEREVEEGFIEVEAVLALAVATAAVWLTVVRLPVAVVNGSFVLVGQDLDGRTEQTPVRTCYYHTLNQLFMDKVLDPHLIGFGNPNKHVLSAWIFVFVRMP